MQYRHRFLISSLALVSSCVLAGCSSDADDSAPKTDAEYQAEVVNGMHATLLTDIDALHDAAVKLAAAAPDHAWDADADADAITAMKTAWMAARSAYEQSEGALAPLFPDIDTEIDARYDDFLETLGPDGDQDLFDNQGVTGMHAIERILYQPVTPQAVIDFEATLPGYKAAAWPATDEEANEFKSELCAELVTDTQTLKDQWVPSSIDLEYSYDGLTALMNEQREKVNKAASEEEESRYSQRTMADIRDNLTGTEKVYALFRPWLTTKADGKTIDGEVQGSFGDLAMAYAQVDGDAFPPLPADWSSENPPADALATPFGQLYTAVQSAVDPNRSGSAVDAMNQAAVALGFETFSE